MLRTIAQTELFTVLLMVCLFLITLSKLLYMKRFRDFIKIMIHFRYVRLYSREQRFFDFFDALLFGNTVVGLSIFMYLCYQYAIESTAVVNVELFLLAFTIAIIFLVKVLLERLVSSYLDIEAVVGDYLFHKISYKNFLGLLLLPLNVILIYGVSVSQIALFFGASILIIINCVGVFLFLKAYQKLILSNIFYFILYLCALEISPYVVFYKLAVNTIIN